MKLLTPVVTVSLCGLSILFAAGCKGKALVPSASVMGGNRDVLAELLDSFQRESGIEFRGARSWSQSGIESVVRDSGIGDEHYGDFLSAHRPESEDERRPYSVAVSISGDLEAALSEIDLSGQPSDPLVDVFPVLVAGKKACAILVFNENGPGTLAGYFCVWEYGEGSFSGWTLARRDSIFIE